jgi:hypothetical protein
MFSKFHFSRMFQRVTGISPGRYLSALRLAEAKRLLIDTSSSVIDISHQVGYASVGTFSSRFRSSVGLSPTMYRRLGGYVPQAPLEARRPAAAATGAVISGTVLPVPTGRTGVISIGVFRDRIPQGHPVRCATLDEPGPFLLPNVPHGSWYLLARFAATGSDRAIPHPVAAGEAPAAEDGPAFLVSSQGPITVRPETTLYKVDVSLRPMTIFDPPVLTSILHTGVPQPDHRMVVTG